MEFIKLAAEFHRRGLAVRLDLGYDVKADKGRFHRPYTDEARSLPPWITLDRVPGLGSVPDYDQGFVAGVLAEVVGRDDRALLPRVHRAAEAIADRLLAHWEDLGVTVVVVENGTLPENITYTHALYLAIERYGARHGLGRFVFWRDHDLMWQSEPGTGKYGAHPYPTTPKPRNSPHIHYFALHEHALRRTTAWAPGLRNISVLPNTFTHAEARVTSRNAAFRADFGIPEGVPLLARFTRVIRQKRIDRDLHLLAGLRARGVDAVLFVAGDTEESPAEHAHLTALGKRLRVDDRVVFGGRLAPYDATGDGYGVRDLLAHATLALFLTSHDYESYGNPVGEAIASGTPYAASRYELYDAVYGDRGFTAPLLDVAEHDLPTAAFTAAVADLITDAERRHAVMAHNHRLGEEHFGRDRVGDAVARLHPVPMGARTRLSVVLPVYDEAANLDRVLASLRDQRGPDGPLDRELYEVVVVDNNSTDDTAAITRRFAAAHPDLAVHLIAEPEQGVSCARRAGMDFAVERGRARPFTDPDERCYLVSADADCVVDPDWLWELFEAMESSKAAIGVCDYYYSAEHFTGRPLLWDAIQRTLRCRLAAWPVLGGFPDGKGFAVEREAYAAVGGIEVFYQLRDGRFVNHLSDDWDFGIRVRGSGHDITFAPRSRVEINPRRVNHALDEVITGRAYGSDGTIVMRDIRVDEPGPARGDDLTPAEARQAWEFSIKDFTPKNLVLPVLLTPSLLEEQRVVEFLGADFAARLGARIAEIRDEMRIVDFTPIHSYKTPSYRLYLEFREELFEVLRRAVGEDIGYPPPLPDCFADVPPERFAEFVRYYCEDRESGEAHNYFGNGGVF
ncbi:glycosyltransferase [Actinokineospora bangkokensis]|uniref:glycosyltransferase n=1 Tax=Actinokineospora bangkokensis TaxID=1193682 RepID=UPI001E5ABA98|nr:glycosyltransferase [Actinokineospora bangkokensis]